MCLMLANLAVIIGLFQLPANQNQIGRGVHCLLQTLASRNHVHEVALELAADHQRILDLKQEFQHLPRLGVIPVKVMRYPIPQEL